MIGIGFFILTVACIPFLPGGANIPRWAFLSLFAAALLFKIEFRFWPLIVCGYVALMAWLAPVGYDAAFIYWHFLLLVVLFCYAQTMPDLRTVAIGIGLGIGANSLVVLAQVFDGWQGIIQITAYSGLFFNRNIASELAAMALVLAVGYRLWWLIPGILPTLYVGARSAVLACGIAGMIALWERDRFWAMMTALGAALLVVTHTNSMESLIARFGVWQDTALNLSFFGHGVGSFIANYPTFQHHSSPLTIRYENTHNDILQVLYELGIGGALLIAILAVRLVKVNRGPEWYALVVFLIEGCFGFPLYEPATGAVAACCAGYLFSRRDDVCHLLFDRRRRIWSWDEDGGLEPFHTVGAAVSAGARKAVGACLRRHHQAGFLQNPLDQGGAAP